MVFSIACDEREGEIAARKEHRQQGAQQDVSRSQANETKEKFNVTKQR